MCWSKVRELVKVAVAQHDAERRRQVAQCATRPTRLAELRNGDVLFIDEIHAIPNQVAVFLYEAMQSRHGNPLGVQRVAGLLGVPAATLERFHEPYLMRLGLIAIVRGGRVAA